MPGLETAFATVVNFLAALLFGMLGVGAAPVFIPTIQSLGYGIVATVFPLAILLNGINSGFAMVPFARAHSVDWRRGGLMSVAAGIFAFTGAYFAAYIPSRTLLYFLVAVLILLAGWTFARVRREGAQAGPNDRRVALVGLPASVAEAFATHSFSRARGGFSQ